MSISIKLDENNSINKCIKRRDGGIVEFAHIPTPVLTGSGSSG
jgi:hypothetical protein